MDGARIWNALVHKQENPNEYGKVFDTISVCLSKGLGAPIGSLLVSDKATIKRALRIRKILGGGMRQVGYLAAAGIYALQNNVNRLVDDHRRAREIGAVLADGTIEYEPMGAYYSDDWIFDDDRLSLSVSGLDLLGALTNKSYTATLTVGTSYTATQALQNILTVTGVGYTAVAQLDHVIITEDDSVIFFADVYKGLTVREILTAIMTMASADWYYDATHYGMGIGYITTSKYNNTVFVKYKMSEIIPSAYVGTFTPVRTVTADNYFKFKNYRNGRKMNTITFFCSMEP
jgi:hypothetical protein